MTGSTWGAPAQSASIETRGLIETHLRAAPDREITGFEAQAASMYENLGCELRRLGATPAEMVTEKIFLSDLPVQVTALSRARSVFHGNQDVMTAATTLVQQPPAWDGRLCEVQTVVMRSAGEERLTRRGLRALPPGATGLVVGEGNLRHIFLAGLTSPVTDPMFRREASAMFELAEEILQREEFSFHDVVRTWIYLADVDANYGYLNLARRDYFISRGIDPPPASTGIRGVPHPAGRGCGMDLRAIAGLGTDRPELHPIGAPTMNEAPEYGADFSRGTRVRLPNRDVIHLSGTASVDNDGCVAHPGQIEAQLNRMLLNLEGLLAGQAAGTGSIVSAITYLKRGSDLDLFRQVAAQRGFPESIPNTIVETDICRTGWLCEIEAVAVLADQGEPEAGP